MARRVARLTIVGTLWFGSWAHSSNELERALAAYKNQNYVEALQLLKPLAESGVSEASHVLGTMYEHGLGVPQSYKWAFAWYLRAASQAPTEGAATLDAKRMAGKLSSNARKTAELWASLKRFTLQSEYGCISYYGDITAEQLDVTSFRASATVEQMVSDIVNYSGLRKNFVVEQANVPNAAAVIYPPGGSSRYLLYNPGFIEQVHELTGTNWGPYSVMAHEIGHHLQGHTIQPGGSRPSIELEADEFSGFILYRMGASIQEATGAMAKIGDPAGSSSHPPRDLRVDAITKGYGRARALDPSPTPPGPRPEPPPLPEPEADQGEREEWPGSPNTTSIARVCQTPVGICPMAIPIPRGAPCYCMTYQGTFAGIAR